MLASHVWPQQTTADTKIDLYHQVLVPAFLRLPRWGTPSPTRDHVTKLRRCIHNCRHLYQKCLCQIIHSRDSPRSTDLRRRLCILCCSIGTTSCPLDYTSTQITSAQTPTFINLTGPTRLRTYVFTPNNVKNTNIPADGLIHSSPSRPTSLLTPTRTSTLLKQRTELPLSRGVISSPIPSPFQTGDTTLANRSACTNG